MELFEFFSAYREEMNNEFASTSYTFTKFQEELWEIEMSWADEFGIECECFED